MAKLHIESPITSVKKSNMDTKTFPNAAKKDSTKPILPQKKAKTTPAIVSGEVVSVETNRVDPVVPDLPLPIKKRIRLPTKAVLNRATLPLTPENQAEKPKPLPAKKRKAGSEQAEQPTIAEAPKPTDDAKPTPPISKEPDSIDKMLQKLTTSFLAPNLTKTGARIEIPMDTFWNVPTFGSRANMMAMQTFLQYNCINPNRWKNATGPELQHLCGKVQKKNCAKKKALLDAQNTSTMDEVSMQTLPYKPNVDAKGQPGAHPQKKRKVETAKPVDDSAPKEIIDPVERVRNIRVRLSTDGGDDYTDISSDEEVEIETRHVEKATDLLNFIKQCAELDMQDQNLPNSTGGLKMMRVAIGSGDLLPQHMDIKTQGLVRDVLRNQIDAKALKENGTSKRERKVAGKKARQEWGKLETRVSKLIDGEGVDVRRAAQLVMSSVLGEDASGQVSDDEY
ncbi:hypothetical protein BDV96DRAFT_668361 [Lophiotrema nucula]|uniref:Uncharacterized protein n=1 Tax=Lophiotrema nucula TaxID=690887 RepID=A0A6A5ZQ74_9PLEO|nr:hypothetical protein BDV96DRAFT_668361 [Lophiotrema nucula]